MSDSEYYELGPEEPQVAQKFDGGKPRPELISPTATRALAEVLAFGAEKYGDHNWLRGGLAWSRMYGALQRHLLAWWGGEELDPESGLSHLAHASACLMMLTHYALETPGAPEDDRVAGSSL